MQGGDLQNQQSFTNEGLSPQQKAAIGKEKELAQRVMDEGKAEEVVNMFKHSVDLDKPVLTYADIGRVMLPDIAGEFPLIAAGAVRRIVNSLVKLDERKLINERKKKLLFEATLEKADPKKLEDARSKARKTRKENIRNGKTKIKTEHLLEINGATQWTEDEDTLLKLVLESEDFRHKTHHHGRPNWQKVVDFINKIYYQRAPTRTRDSVIGNAKAKGYL